MALGHDDIVRILSVIALTIGVTTIILYIMKKIKTT
jgi:phage shock protein PspC (stress-responsive transcriptional regulator)